MSFLTRDHTATRRSRGAGSLLAGALALGLAALCGASDAAAQVPVLTGTSDGITVGATDFRVVPASVNGGPAQWNGTLVDVTMTTNSIWEPIHTFIYLPANYPNNAPPGGYQTLYLLHGAGGGGASAWTTGNNLPILDANFPGIAVLVEGGRAGWYTNWVSRDLKNHLFNWQTFHTRELVGWIDHHFATNANRSARAIAGLSMGGHGALSYAGQRPDLYTKVGSFSGPGNIEDPSISQLVIANEVTRFAGTVSEFGSSIYPSEKGDLQARAADVTLVLGPMTPYYNTWAPKNPYKLGNVYLTNHIDVSLYAGWGGTNDATASTLEYVAGQGNNKMYSKFKTDGLQVRYCTGLGDHSMTYWSADLEDWLKHAYQNQPQGAACPSNWGAPQP